MKKTILTLTLTLVIGIFLSYAQTYSGGAGTTASPFQIANKADLKYLSENSAEWSNHFIQTADITFTTADFASGGDFYNAGEGFIPIGNNIIRFTGTYNGDNFTIDSLYINRPTSAYIGLFGYADGSTISNIGVSNLDVTGANNTGGLVGYNYNNSSISNAYSTGSVTGANSTGGLVGYNYNNSSISNAYGTGSVTGAINTGGLVGQNDFNSSITNAYSTSSVTGTYQTGGLVGYNSNHSSISNAYSTGSVTGTNNSIGGLVGYNYDNSSITNAYSTANVTGTNNYTGGLVGYNYRNSSISNAYSTGSVTGNSFTGGLVGHNNFYSSITNAYSTGSVTGAINTGGLVGYNSSSTTTNSFWDTQTSGQATSVGGTGQTTAQMQTLSTFTAVGWDFTNETANGTADIWEMTCGNGYPILTWQLFASGDGSLANPFTISNKQDLKTLSENSCLWDKHFIQTANITFTAADFASGGDFNNGGQGFSPIGNWQTKFTGSYNGDDFTIDSLYINRPSSDQIGLFGYTNGSTISNIGLTNVDINGYLETGGLVGESLNSSISNAYSSGSVTGYDNTGGLVGHNFNSSISNTYSSGSVTGSTNTGGLVGHNYDNSSISNAYSSGSVTGTSYTGGLVGKSTYSAISNAYSSGSVTGTSNYTGGLVGFNFNISSISNAYSSGSVTGTSYTGGLVGQNDYNSSISNAYSSGSVTGTSYTGGLVGFNNISATTNSFWDTQTSGLSSSAGGTGQTTAQMQTLSTFTAATWDFTNETANGTADIWLMNCGDYPILSWQTSTPAIACAFIWTGNTSTDWNVASNWSSNLVPSASDSIVIPTTPAGSFFPTTTSNITVENLTIETNATLTIGATYGLIIEEDGTVTNNGNVTLAADASGSAWLDDFTNTNTTFAGNILAQQYVTTGSSLGQRYFGSPVNNGVVQGLDGTYAGGTGQVVMSNCASAQVDQGSPYSNMFEWRENISSANNCEYEGWFAINAASTLENGRAYSGWMQDASIISFTGVPNTGNVSYGGTLSNTNTGVVNKDGWHLLSNPYPSAMVATSLTSANWNSLQTYNGASGAYGGTFQPINPGQALAPMQGFVAFTTSNNNSANFTNTMRTQGNSQFKNLDDWFIAKLNIEVAGNNFSDISYIYFNDDATATFDNQWDCKKRESLAGQPTLYTLLANEKVSLNGNNIAELGNQSFPLGLKPGAAASFTFTVSGLETLPSTTLVYLEDKATGTWTNLRETNTYSFNMTTSEAEDRFEIHFTKPVELAFNEESCTGNDGSINIDFGNQNINGNNIVWNYQLIKNGQTLNASTESDALNFENLTPGTYELVLSNGTYQTTQLIEIEDKTQVEADFQLSNTSIFVGDELSINNLSNGANTYTWTINNETFNTPDLSYQFDQEGVYEINLLAQNNDCSDNNVTTVEVLPKSITAINDIQGNDGIKVFAFNKTITIDLSNADLTGKTDISVYDLVGQLIAQILDAKDMELIKLDNNATGIYIVNILNNGVATSKKVIIK